MTTLIGLNSSTLIHRPKVVIVGPGPSQVGGVATFTEILFSSEFLRDRYTLLHLDITRGPRGTGLVNRFAIINLIYFIRQAFNFLEILIEYKPRLIHLPITSYWAFWKDAAFILMARMAGMKVVAHLHGGLFDQYYRQRPRLEKRLIGWILRCANTIIALSNRWKHFLLEEVRGDLNVVVVPNTVDAMFSTAISTLPGRTSRDPNMILFVGGLGRRKGVYDILRSVPLVLERYPMAHFAFAGTEEVKGEWERIQQTCTEIGHNDAVQFLGQVTGPKKLELFLDASIFLLPSYGENLPYALLEAMAVGLPVITTPVGAIPELVEDGRNGFLIEPGDYQALAKRILQLLEDTKLQSSMRQANIEKIKRAYLPEIAMAQFDDIYKKLLSEP